MIPYTGWIKVIGKLNYTRLEEHGDDMNGDVFRELADINDEVMLYVQQPASGVKADMQGTGFTKNATVEIPAGSEMMFGADALFAYADDPYPWLAKETAVWTMEDVDYAWMNYFDEEIDGDWVQHKDCISVFVEGREELAGKKFKLKATAQDGSGKSITITVKVTEPLPPQ